MSAYQNIHVVDKAELNILLPQNIIDKIKEYVPLHPVADLFKTKVEIISTEDYDYSELINIVTNDEERRLSYNWTTKEFDDLHYSHEIEKRIVFNKLKSIITKLMTYDTLNDSVYKKLRYMYRNLDPVFKHLNKKILINFSRDPDPFFKLFTDTEEDYSNCWGEYHFYEEHLSIFYDNDHVVGFDCDDDYDCDYDI